MKLFNVMAIVPIVLLLLCCCNSLQPVFNADTSCHFDIPAHVNSVVPPRGKHVGARVQLYANSVATFQILLLISGDINPNPGPTNNNGQAILANDHNLNICTYDSQTLHSFNSVCSSSSKKWREDNSIVWNRIVSLGISRGRRTHRGKRGGRDLLKGHLKFGVLNARSLRNKSTIFQDFVLDRIDWTSFASVKPGYHLMMMQPLLIYVLVVMSSNIVPDSQSGEGVSLSFTRITFKSPSSLQTSMTVLNQCLQPLQVTHQAWTSQLCTDHRVIRTFQRSSKIFQSSLTGEFAGCRPS